MSVPEGTEISSVRGRLVTGNRSIGISPSTASSQLSQLVDSGGQLVDLLEAAAADVALGRPVLQLQEPHHARE